MTFSYKIKKLIQKTFFWEDTQAPLEQHDPVLWRTIMFHVGFSSFFHFVYFYGVKSLSRVQYPYKFTLYGFPLSEVTSSLPVCTNPSINFWLMRKYPSVFVTFIFRVLIRRRYVHKRVWSNRFSAWKNQKAISPTLSCEIERRKINFIYLFSFPELKFRYKKGFQT